MSRYRPVCAVAGMIALVACSSTGNDGNDGGATNAVGGTGIIISQGGGSGVTPGSEVLDPGDVCAGLALEPEPAEKEEEITTTRATEVSEPVAIYVMLDNSTSMTDPAGGGERSKWEEAVDALTTFVNDSASADIDIAIQYFNPRGVSDGPEECDGSGHEVPAVEMGPLLEHADARYDEHTPTWLEPALVC